MTNLKIFILGDRKNEDGYVMISALLVSVLVIIIGVMSVRTSSSDLEISTNDQLRGRSFYAAETARAFVRANPDLYGSGNTTNGTPASFSDANVPTITRLKILGENKGFKVTVEYLIDRSCPRGSGNSTPTFRCHYYEMVCEGDGPRYVAALPRESITEIEAGFYRIGF